MSKESEGIWNESSVAFTTPTTAVSLDRWLLESVKLFRTVGNYYYFFNLLLDSKEFAAFLQINTHFEKMIRPHNFDEKKKFKVGKPCLFTFAWQGRAWPARTFKTRVISHFLVTRLRAVRKLYEATLSFFSLVFLPLLPSYARAFE